LCVDAAGQAPAHGQKRKFLKSPLETLRIDGTYGDINYVRGLYTYKHDKCKRNKKQNRRIYNGLC